VLAARAAAPRPQPASTSSATGNPSAKASSVVARIEELRQAALAARAQSEAATANETRPAPSTAPRAPARRRSSGSKAAPKAILSIDAPDTDGGKRRQRQKPETRAQMLERLTNPLISLHEASVLLKVCSATVRHYSDAGILPHVRTQGGQRRFYLRDVMTLWRQWEAERRQT
jgi:excisionase family DNA binding protein